MDKYENRRRRALDLLQDRCGGKQAEFAKKIGRTGSYVSRMLSSPGKAGHKRIADDMKELIETAFELSVGDLDIPVTDFGSKTNVTALSAEEPRGPLDPSWPFALPRPLFEKLPSSDRDAIDVYLSATYDAFARREQKKEPRHRS